MSYVTLPSVRVACSSHRPALTLARCSVAAHCALLRVLATPALRASDVRKLTRGAPCFTGLIDGYCSHWLRRLFRPHWAYFALLRPQGARFVRPPPLPSSIRNGRSASSHRPRLRRCGVPWLRTALRFVCSPLQPFGPPMCGPPLLIGLTTACFRHRRRPSCAPLQFPLKSYGFPGAETARKRFLLWKMGFSGAKIAPSPPYTPPGTIEARKGFAPLFGFSAVWDCERLLLFFRSPF